MYWSLRVCEFENDADKPVLGQKWPWQFGRKTKEMNTKCLAGLEPLLLCFATVSANLVRNQTQDVCKEAIQALKY